MNDAKTEPCLKGLTENCFRVHPAFAKRVFAYRLLMLLIGGETLKRLQTIPGGIFQRLLITLPEIPSPAELVPITVSPIQPLYISPWEPGPIITSQPTQEEDAVPAILKAKIDISTAADIEVIAAVATRKISISSIVFTVAGETNITLKSGATAISGAMDFGGTNEPMGMSHGMGDMPLQTVAGEAFVISNSIAVQVSGWITYFLS